MCGNTFITVIRKSCVPNCQLLLQLTTHTMVKVYHMPHQRFFEKKLYDQCVIYTGIQNIIGEMFNEVLKSRLSGEILKQCTI